MKKIILFVLLSIFFGVSAEAQATDKKDGDKPKTTTIDAWRNAIPNSEEPIDVVPVTNEQTNFSEVAERPEDLDYKIRGLETAVMEAIKTRESSTLKNLLANDFVLAGIGIGGTKSDKTRYINWTLKDLELKTYEFNGIIVRVFPTTAFVTYNYKRRANIDTVASDGDFTVTNIWTRRGDQWQLMSHHISPAPKL